MSMPFTPGDRNRTLALLWRRINEIGNLPGFDNVVSKIARATQGEGQGDDDSEFDMTETVLSDPSLTQRVLRLANSAIYRNYGEIHTVSKAVMVLGTEPIGHLALGQKLIESLSSVSDGSADVRREMEVAVLASHVAREVMATNHPRDAEKAVVCSILHGLGRMMVSYYLPEVWLLVQQTSTDLDIDETQAAAEVLGLPVDEVSRLIAHKWGLPRALAETLREIPPQPRSEALDHAEWMAALSTMTHACATIIRNAGPDDAVSLSQVAAAYSEMLGFDTESLISAVLRAQASSEEALAMVGLSKAARRTPAPDERDRARSRGGSNALRNLRRGAADMRDMAGKATTSQMMAIALEIMQQSLGLDKTIAFVRDRKAGRYLAGMSFGPHVKHLIPRLTFSDTFAPDVFHLALASDKMICVEDARAPVFRNKLPRWWTDEFENVQGFIVVPVSLKGQPAGFLYGDWDVPSAHSLKENELEILNEIRGLILRSETP